MVIGISAAPRVLQGQRVVLRPYGEGFGQEELRRVYAWSQDKEILALSGGAPVHLAYESFVQHFWRERDGEWDKRILYAIFAPSSSRPDSQPGAEAGLQWSVRPNAEGGLLIGRLGCFAIDPRRRQGELGIVLGDRDYWGRGYGPDALRTFLRYLFQEAGLRRLYLYTGVENLRAQRAFAKVGFRSLGVVRRVFSDFSAREDIHMEISPQDLTPDEDTGLDRIP